tara:strand:- start:265 stop:462 length:198 start_codon:yes stop_codon:yes gene_type:complete
MEKTYSMRKLIKYVEGLEKAYALIDNDSTLTEDFKYKLKKVQNELGFIIEDIDNEYRKEFYGEEE